MIDEQRFEALNEAVVEILSRQRSFEQRLADLEGVSRLTPNGPNLAAAPITEPVPPPLPGPSSASAIETLPLTSTEPAFAVSEDQTEPHRESKPAIETKVGLTLVNRIGVITLILGVAFFFRWAVDNNWIGPAGRVVIGLVAGFAALGIADYLWRKAQQVFAQGIAGAGLSILYLSVYAAFDFYHLIPQFAAFAFMFSATALAIAFSLRFNSAAIAVLGLLGGYATPLLLSTGEDNPPFLLSYLFLLNAAAMVLAKRKHWRALEWLSLVATALIYWSWFYSRPGHRGTVSATLGVVAYYALFIYAGSPLIVLVSIPIAALEISGVWHDESGPFFALELLISGAAFWYATKHSKAGILRAAFVSFWACAGLFLWGAVNSSVGGEFTGLTAGFLLFLLFGLFTGVQPKNKLGGSVQNLSILAANGSVYYGLAYLLLRNHYHEWLGLLAVCVAGTYLALAVVLRGRVPALDGVGARPLLITLGMAMAFITLAIPVQLTGFRITIGWAIQAAALTWIGSRLNSQRSLLPGALILLLVAIRLVVFDASFYPSDIHAATVFLNSRFTAFTISAVCSFLAARWAFASDRRVALGEYFGAHAALLTGLTLETILWAQKSAEPGNLLSVETVSVSVLFAVYALALVGIGVATRTAVNRIAGLALIGVVIAKLYLFDIWQLDRVYRITAFVALGLLLISTSFLYSRFRPVIEALLRSDQE